MDNKKVLILVNHDVVIYNFRKELVERLLEEGYEVYISSPYGERIDYLVEMGCKYIETDIERHGTNIFNEFKLLKEYIKIMKKINPNLVISYTIKPNIYGGIACRILKVPYIATITGLGISAQKKGLIRSVSILLYKLAFKDIHNLFFQNELNRRFFIDNNIAIDQHILVPGSGVNLSDYSFEDYPSNEYLIKVLFIGRIMKDKGIGEFNQAAKILKNKYKNIEFEAIGFVEEEYKETVKELSELDVVKFRGVVENVHQYIKESHVVVLPSYHEGMANVLLEAASTGRPLIASNIPGCKETFDENISGFGIEIRDTNDLALKIEKFINLSCDKKKQMGIASRNKMEKQFDREFVVDKYMNSIENII
ncbi:MAG: glycosyltransferase family 4 protein [Senegalia sp. (in: firmicutes)]|uniref:glycosyltransferase family 4 protein n=1 Tax=Bacillota TaxID=1239 RepID=UPI003F9CC04D